MKKKEINKKKLIIDLEKQYEDDYKLMQVMSQTKEVRHNTTSLTKSTNTLKNLMIKIHDEQEQRNNKTGKALHLSNEAFKNEYNMFNKRKNKNVNAETGRRPIDISITKNVLGLMFDSALLVILILLCARWYKKHDVLKEKPSGLAALVEPVIVMINDDVIKEAVGPQHAKFSPYLLTAFFFILINNLMGIFPIFPGGANITGNIAVTGVLALFTFLAVNLFGNRHYYKDIFWPDVPLFLKAIPIMPAIEVLGTITKPFSLMIRLFANMLAGHIMLLSVIAVIFLTKNMAPVMNGSLSVISVLFGVFLDVLEVFVACIQAYVFTMLSALFIGMAHQEPENH